jgi:D-sedoheptulose 7-phosphate isomerase
MRGVPMNNDPQIDFIARSVQDCTQTIGRLLKAPVLKRIIDISERINACLRAHQKVILFGNGGSAAQAQHAAAEFIGSGFAAIALSADGAVLTALANDYNYRDVFCWQLESLMDSQDFVIGISTSGNSMNVIKALEYANTHGAHTVSLTGPHPGLMEDFSQYNISVESVDTQRIQEAHIFILHVIWKLIMRRVADG